MSGISIVNSSVDIQFEDEQTYMLDIRQKHPQCGLCSLSSHLQIVCDYSSQVNPQTHCRQHHQGKQVLFLDHELNVSIQQLLQGIKVDITSKRYSVGAHGSGRTWYWCNMSVVTRRNLAVSDIYISIFSQNAPYSLFALLCRYSRSQASHRYISRSAAP